MDHDRASGLNLNISHEWDPRADCAGWMHGKNTACTWVALLVGDVALCEQLGPLLDSLCGG